MFMSSYIEYAKKDYEDWFYANKAKGDYKICKQCGGVKLRNGHFFNKEKKGKDGLKSICKECEALKKKKK